MLFSKEKVGDDASHSWIAGSLLNLIPKIATVKNEEINDINTINKN